MESTEVGLLSHYMAETALRVPDRGHFSPVWYPCVPAHQPYTTLGTPGPGTPVAASFLFQQSIWHRKIPEQLLMASYP